MTTPAFEPAVAGLHDLSPETRMIATPWSRIVRGLGLGQHPIRYDPAVAAHLRRAWDRLSAKLGGARGQMAVGRLVTTLVLDHLDPERPSSPSDVGRALAPLAAALRSEPDPYRRVMSGCVLLDALAKLGLDPTAVEGTSDVADEVLVAVDAIEPDRIRDENQGRHGAYERLSAATAVFLAFGNLGIQSRLTADGRDRVRDALDLLDGVPAPFFRGRGGSMLFSSAALLGRDDLLVRGGRDRVQEVLDYAGQAGAPGLRPAFPQPMTPAFCEFYPLVTMLNAVAMAGRPDCLTRGRDRLAQARALWADLAPVEQTHMGLYYVVALHNLGRLPDQITDLDAFVAGIVDQWRDIEPGANYFLNGIAYAYMAETALLTGRLGLIGDDMLDRLADGFPGLDGTDADRDNRPYPFSYAVNALGEIGAADRLFLPRARYGGRSALDWVVDALSPGGHREDGRLYMLGNALTGFALRMRGPERRDTPIFSAFGERLGGRAAPQDRRSAKLPPLSRF